MVEFIQLEDPNSESFNEAIKIYVDSLPTAERQTIDTIKERMASKKEKMVIGFLGNEVVMAALIWPFQGTDFVLLDYMAVKKGYRKQGIGSTFISNISKLTNMGNKIFILEVEDPQREKRNWNKREKNPVLSTKRRKNFERCSLSVAAIARGYIHSNGDYGYFSNRKILATWKCCKRPH